MKEFSACWGLKLSLLVGIVLLSFCGYVASTPFTYGELDLNGDGFLSFSEIDYVSSYGVRDIEHAGAQCLEYYALKDGLPLKVVCI